DSPAHNLQVYGLQFQSQTGSTGHSDSGTSSIAWEAKENKCLRGSLFLEVFWPKTARHFWGISSSSRFWRRARVHAQHGRHCDPRSTVQLKPRTSVLQLLLTHAHQLTSCPHYPKAGPSPLHVLGRLIRSIVGLTLAVNLGGRAQALYGGSDCIL